jgi:tRNA (cmo5U34)-methyltransferase
VKTEIEERFADARKYDAIVARIFPGYTQLPFLVLSYLRTCLGSRARVLDVGCGTGTTLLTFATEQPEWSLVGVEPAETMLELARVKAGELEVEDRLEFVTGTADALPDEPTFDAAISVLVLHLLPEDRAKLRFLEEVSRRLTPKGWFVLVGVHGNLTTVSGRRALDAWVQFVALQGLPEQVQTGVRHKVTTEDSIVSEECIRELLTQVGFVNVERIYHSQLLGGWIAQNSGKNISK